MDVSALTIKLIILLIPGAIGSLIIERLTVHKPWTSFRFTITSIIIGVLSYSFLQLLCKCSSKESLAVWNSLSSTDNIPYDEVIYSSIIGVLWGIVVTAADTHKWINNLAKKLHISYKYGDENLYSYFLNANETDYVYVRHIKNKLTYSGQVSSYSETDEVKEIVLNNVTVYDYETSDELYDVDRIYLSFPKDDIIIEFAKID